MARDPDAQMVVFKDTRGRRSTSQKIRDWLSVFKGTSQAGDAARTVIDAIGTGALFGTLVYTGRPKILSTLNAPLAGSATGYSTAFILYNTSRTDSVVVAPTILGKPVTSIAIVHPDVGVTEGLGILALLGSLPGGDITGFIEKGLGIGAYHALLNGFKFTLPGITSTTLTAWTAADWAKFFLVGFGGSYLLDGISKTFAGAPPPTSNTELAFSGLMGVLVWTTFDLQTKMQTDIDSGKLTWPLTLHRLPNGIQAGFPFDDIVIPLYIQRWLHDLGHSGLILMLFRRGLGQKLLE